MFCKKLNTLSQMAQLRCDFNYEIKQSPTQQEVVLINGLKLLSSCVKKPFYCVMNFFLLAVSKNALKKKCKGFQSSFELFWTSKKQECFVNFLFLPNKFRLLQGNDKKKNALIVTKHGHKCSFICLQIKPFLITCCHCLSVYHIAQ